MSANGKPKKIILNQGEELYALSDQAKIAFPVAIEETNRRLAKRGRPPINFGMGQVAPEATPVDFLRDFFISLSNSSDEELLSLSLYGPTRGDKECISSIKKLLKMDDIFVKDKNICLTTGAVQGFVLTIRTLANSGDTIFCEAPTYSLNLKTLIEHELNVIGIPLKHNGIDIDNLLNKIEIGEENGAIFRFIYLIPDFQNPTGMVMSLDQRKKIISIARKNNLMIIEDAPYRFISYDGNDSPLPSIYSMAPDITVFIGSLTKIFCAGFRVGFLVGPKEIINKAICFKQGYDVNVPKICQKIVTAYLHDENSFKSNLKRIVQVQKEKRDLMLQKMNEFFPKNKGVSWNIPTGGIFIWVELPEQIDAKNIWEEAIDIEGIGISLGEGFFPSNCRKTNCFRLSFSYPTIKQIGEGITRLASIIENNILDHEKNKEQNIIRRRDYG